MMKLYGTAQSSAFRVHWMLKEMGAAYEQIPLDMAKGEHKQAEFLALNPNGKVPTLVDGTFVVWESLAINRYLAEKYDQDLLGRTPEENALIEQWSVWSLAHLGPACLTIYGQKWFGENTPEVNAKAMEMIQKLFGILDGALVGKNYLVKEQFTLADINTGAAVATAIDDAGADISHYPHLQAWYKRITDRPSYQAIQ